MANPEHLRILHQGKVEWNKWRSENPDIRPDLSRAKLSNESFVGIFSDCYNLSNTNLAKADLVRADLSFANLRDADLSQALCADAKLLGAKLDGANLNQISLFAADCRQADFSHCDLNGADLRSSDLGRASLIGAALSNSDLNDATLFTTDLLDTDLNGAKIGWTIFADCDLGRVGGLESVNHQGPSEIGIGTIFRSAGHIPEIFLRNAGVPEIFITFSKSLVGKTIDFYSCFISFTEEDDLFAERLYNDLQAAGVRCWRWKEDAKWGRTLMRSIDEAVRVYNKLVVICSEASLKSPAVIREIERALQKEDYLTRQGKDDEVLFPIRLDDYIFTGWNHHRKADVTAKNIGDFRQWKEPEHYRKSLQRLICDLKSENQSTE